MLDTIIIGAGPSGLSCALNLRRDNKEVLLIEKEGIGGQIAKSPKVENIPGTKSISGLEFVDNLTAQVMDLGANFEFDEVISIAKENNIFKVNTKYNSFESKTVIIATGAKHRKMNLPNEDELIGKGISYCAVCDGAFYKDQDVVLIGDANTALQYALVLSSYCKHVYLNTLFDKFFGDKILVSRVLEKNNIIVEHNLNLIKINGKNELESLIFENTQTKEIKEFKTKGCFIAIGQIPQNEIFKELVDLNKGFIITNEKMETKTSGLYAIGDCKDKLLRQLTTSFNDGSIAAYFASHYIDTNF
ncbi:MAG: FAD-dependent oxidoreductase [Bacilli bacterium]|nr:FAD-dependent oxidoreductase [Bacilli bacterium]